MKTNTNSRYAIAVLIDGDNASFEKMEDIMGFVSRYGDAVVRRIYGDWTRKSLSAWKETAREHGFRLVQASSHTLGKNTTDIALVIDAMDILRDGRADCFCLVASDGDYSLLAQRLREAGLKVLGYGEGKTPVSLVRSCSVFLYADWKENKVIENTPEFFLEKALESFDNAFKQATDDSMNGDKLLGNYDIARLLNVSLRTVARYREKGLIRYYQTDENGKNFYRSSDIQDFLQKRGKKN